MDRSLPAIDSIPDDTRPAIRSLLIEGYRKMSPAQKLERVRALNHTVQRTCADGHSAKASDR